MLHMKEDETIDTFTKKLTTSVNKAASLGHTMEDETLVRKLLNDVPDRHLQIVASIEQYSDLSKMTMKEAIGRLNTYEERIKANSNWISSCLNNAIGSVLVNGSPTFEFQSHKGLKQGDPISPFLFILIMETLHLTFKRVLNAGLYKGISLNDPFTISHLFYADDVVFIGEWNNNKIQTLLSVLRCFYLASGLKINLHKSKLMGIGVSSNVVAAAASLIGCSILTVLFNYLGVKVGRNMSRITSWDDVISNVSSRLSKWKLKLISIGGRLSLLKSVLTSIPHYHMSIFKVPIGVLNHLESIHQNFFYGVDGSDRKLAWIGWNMVITLQKNGGLGV
nr:RNA-directed DNA polymerase, eukaryota [Tanacetum cinerariifolium]